MSKNSATRIIQSLLSKHDHLSTQQIFQMSTDNLRPVLQPAHVLGDDGRIKMKRVSNMREGRRPWVPIPAAPFPDHPFQSVNFLKRTILASLESQGLIHMARIHRPIETEEERRAAVQAAMRLTRKDERTAERLKQPAPPPRQPKTTIQEFAWKIGPAPETHKAEEQEYDEDGERTEESDRALAMRMRQAWAAGRPQSSSSSRAPDPQDMAVRWDRAAKLEEAFRRAKVLEDEQIAQRKEARAKAYKLERMQRKQEREEDELAGRSEAVRAEKRRIAALEAIEKYAQETGEDVSAWYEELGVAKDEGIPISEERQRREKRRGFGFKRDP
ncbi:hypothetical protein IAU60_004996 [Kwoniella sp. DSM 27419]